MASEPLFIDSAHERERIDQCARDGFSFSHRGVQSFVVGLVSAQKVSTHSLVQGFKNSLKRSVKNEMSYAAAVATAAGAWDKVCYVTRFVTNVPEEFAKRLLKKDGDFLYFNPS